MRPPLDKEETLAVVEPYFEAVRLAFIGYGLRRVEKSKLDASQKVRTSPRHYAATRDDGLLVIVCAELADLPEDEVIGILAHELGHAADYLYPCRYQLAAGELIEWERGDDDRAEYNRAKQWHGRDEELVERTADRIASKVFGRPIQYTGPCMLQSFERGMAPRPALLR